VIEVYCYYFNWLTVNHLELALFIRFVIYAKVNYLQILSRKIIKMSETVIRFELEKKNKNSVRYKEIPEEGKPPVLGSIYVQSWYAGNSKNIEVTIKKSD